MNFVAVFHFAPEGGGPLVAARWQHGPTPGIKVHSAWVSTSPWADMNEGLGSGRTFIAFEAETVAAVSQFVNYLQLVSSRIEVWPVQDYLPMLEAYESGDPAKFPVNPNFSEEQRESILGLANQYKNAATIEEAVQIWRDSPAAAANVRTAKRRVEGGDW